MEMIYDVVIVGAGPAGIYLGWQLSKKGRAVLIVEKESSNLVGSKMDQFHMDKHTFENYGVPFPILGTEEYITSFEITNHYSPTGKYIQKMKWPVIAMRFQFFIQRLINLASADGVSFEFSCSYKKGVFHENKLIGIIAEKENKDLKFLGKIIVDASGTNAVIRTSLPKDYGIETFKIEDEEKMYVIQRVIRWLNPDEPHPGKEIKSNTWMYYKNWIAPHFLPNANIFGNGQPGGFHNAEKANKIFLENINIPPYEILEEHKATTVYRRSPYSLIADAFFCIGDSACMTKPFNGEGISLSWAVAKIATEVFIKLLESSEFISKEKLWEINVKYFKNDGAKIAALLARYQLQQIHRKMKWNIYLKKT